jgi:hypothetical protein
MGSSPIRYSWVCSLMAKQTAVNRKTGGSTPSVSACARSSTDERLATDEKVAGSNPVGCSDRAL